MSLPETLVNSILTQLKQIIKEHAEGKNPSKEAAIEAIEKYLQTEFNKLSGEDKKQLYKKLSAQLHPDKLNQKLATGAPDRDINDIDAANNSDFSTEDAPNFKKLGFASSDFQTILNKFNANYFNLQTSIKGAAQSPTAWAYKIILVYAQIVKLRSQQAAVEEEYRAAFEAGIKRQRENLAQLIPGYKIVSTMNDGLDRYVQPFRFLVKTIYFLIKTVSVLGVILTLIPSLLVAGVRALFNFLVNVASGGEYNKRIAAFWDAHQEEMNDALANHIEFLKSLDESTAHLSNEDYVTHIKAEANILPNELLKQLKTLETMQKFISVVRRSSVSSSSQQQVQQTIRKIQLRIEANCEEIDNSLKDAVKPTVLTPLRSLGLAAIALLRPWPSRPLSWPAKALLLLIYPVRLVLGLALLTAVTAGILAEKLTTAVVLGVSALNVLINVLSLFVLNLPRYIFNAPVNLFHFISAQFRSDTQESASPFPDLNSHETKTRILVTSQGTYAKLFKTSAEAFAYTQYSKEQYQITKVNVTKQKTTEGSVMYYSDRKTGQVAKFLKNTSTTVENDFITSEKQATSYTFQGFVNNP